MTETITNWAGDIGYFAERLHGRYSTDASYAVLATLKG